MLLYSENCTWQLLICSPKAQIPIVLQHGNENSRYDENIVYVCIYHGIWYSIIYIYYKYVWVYICIYIHTHIHNSKVSIMSKVSVQCTNLSVSRGTGKE